MKRILEVLLEEFRDLLPETENSIPREAHFPDIPKMINVAIGMRRSGKTYLLFQKIRELLSSGIPLDCILFLNFEDDRILPLDESKLAALVDAFYELYPQNHDRVCYLFFDEIQNVKGWPLVVRRLFDRKKVRLYLTGSSAKLLSKEIATSLRGRCVETEVYPYSFSEFLIAQNYKIPEKPWGKKAIDQANIYLLNYMSKGGFPAIQHLHDNERLDILQNYIDTVIFRDIIERYHISNITLMKYLIRTLIKNVSARFTVNKFYKDIQSQGFQIGKDTLYQYLGYLEEAFLVFPVSLFSESLRKSQTTPKKMYIIDNGLVCANRLGISLKQGSLFENQIYMDLRRQKKKVFYYQTDEGYEVDFVTLSSNGSIDLIQAVWDIHDSETYERESRALKSAEKELGVKGQIITPEDYLRGKLLQ